MLSDDIFNFGLAKAGGLFAHSKRLLPHSHKDVRTHKEVDTQKLLFRGLRQLN